MTLFSNGMTIGMVLPDFDMQSPGFKTLVNSFRLQMFQEGTKSNLAGLIMTSVWAFFPKNDTNLIKNMVNIFEQEGAAVEADTDVRLNRNKSFNRLKFKPSKRHIDITEQELSATDNNHIPINNSQLSAAKTARLIKKKLNTGSHIQYEQLAKSPSVN